MALAETGRFAEAVSVQQQVMSNLPPAVESRLRQQLNEALRAYQQSRPWRHPWFYGEPMELIDVSQTSRS